MTPHPQAELLRAIADGLLLERDTAFGDLEWKACLPDIALTLIAQGRDSELRIKPKTIMIGDMEVTEPMRVAPEVGAAVWLADTTSSNPRCTVWVDSALQNKCLNRRICQATEEGARDMLAALVKQLGGVL